MSWGHGLQDAQKTMGVITLALLITHHVEPSGDFAVVPIWVKLACATAIALGTYSGGWRIMRTLGRKVFKLDGSAGFTAQTVASSVLMTTASMSLPYRKEWCEARSDVGTGVCAASSPNR